MYGTTTFSSPDSTAIIDSGTSFISITKSDYLSLYEMIIAQVPSLNFYSGYPGLCSDIEG